MTGASSDEIAEIQPEVLVVERDLRWLRAPLAAPVDIERKRLLRALLGALVRARITAPGTAVSRTELLFAGWPNERMIPSSAGNRLRVALVGLRNLGLRALLLRDAHGWWLDPDVPLRVVSSEPRAPGRFLAPVIRRSSGDGITQPFQTHDPARQRRVCVGLEARA